MTRIFNWTEKRDVLLRELRRQGLSLIETATAIGCDVDHVKVRARELGLLMASRRAPATHEVAAVPRPAGCTPRRAAKEYQGVSGTARKAPSGSSSVDPVCTEGGTPHKEAVVTGRSPAARTRPQLIDLSRAPSSMERQADKWAGRA